MTALRQCYEGVERDGEVIRVRDTVLLRSGPRKKSLPYVAKISALWDDPKTGEKMFTMIISALNYINMSICNVCRDFFFSAFRRGITCH